MVKGNTTPANNDNPNPNMETCEECGKQFWPESIKAHKHEAHAKAEKATKAEEKKPETGKTGSTGAPKPATGPR